MAAVAVDTTITSMASLVVVVGIITMITKKVSVAAEVITITSMEGLVVAAGIITMIMKKVSVAAEAITVMSMASLVVVENIITIIMKMADALVAAVMKSITTIIMNSIIITTKKRMKLDNLLNRVSFRVRPFYQYERRNC